MDPDNLVLLPEHAMNLRQVLALTAVLALGTTAATFTNSHVAAASEPTATVEFIDVPEAIVDLTVGATVIHAIAADGAEIQVIDAIAGDVIDRIPTSGARRITSEQILIGNQVWWYGNDLRDLMFFWEGTDVRDIAYELQLLVVAHDRLEWFDGASHIGGIGIGDGEPAILSDDGLIAA